MKSFGELLKEMGFNPDAPEGVQKAFFQHLAQQAQSPAPIKPIANANEPQKNQQLSLDFDSVDSIVCNYSNKNKKVS